MSIFLNWRNYTPGSVDRFITNLFSYLSPRWYPVNVIKSTVYDIFNAYADQLSSASSEVNQTYNDLFLKTVRATPIYDSTQSKIYENFGVLTEINKFMDQDYNYFSTIYQLHGYRQELKFLIESFYSGTLIEGLERVGQAFTGVSPLVIEPYLDRTGWNLTTFISTIVGTSSVSGINYIISSSSLPRIGYVLPIGSDAAFSVGDPYVMSYSKLGVNTKLGGQRDVYNSVNVVIYGSSSSVNNVSFRSLVEKSVNEILRADMYAYVTYSTNSVYYRPQLSTTSVVVDTVFSKSSYGYLYNYTPTSALGSTYDTDVMQLPGDFRNYDWYYDWCVLSKNDSSYTFSVRSYPSQSIPDTVYYSDYNTISIPYLTALTSYSSSVEGHWTFENRNIMADVSGNGNSLLRILATGSTPNYMPSRVQGAYGIYSAGLTVYTGSTGISLNGGNSFFGEMWVYGLDINSTFSKLFFKRQQIATDYDFSLNNTGYMFGINPVSETMLFSIRSGSVTYTLNSSISNIFQEEASRFHYLAFTYNSGSVALYIDGSCSVAATSSVLHTNPSIMPFYTTFMVDGPNVGVDEVLISNGFLTAEYAQERFLETKPRFYSLGLASESVKEYHQGRITVYAQGANEVEFHQFSIRGTPNQNIYVFDQKSTEILRLPLFSANSNILNEYQHEIII